MNRKILVRMVYAWGLYDCSGLVAYRFVSIRMKNSMKNTPRVELPEGMPQLRVMPLPSDATTHGAGFAGWIMAQVDIAGSLLAVRHADGRVATVAVNSFTFKQPVFVGNLLSFYTKIVKVGNTAITVTVE